MQTTRVLLASILTVLWIAPASAAKKCGTERWDVKTLSDAAASDVKSTVVHTTVASLNKLPNRCSSIPKDRDTDIEETLYEVVGKITFAAHEADRDIHLGIQDLNPPKRTMIVEIADPTCPGAKDSTYLSRFKTVRTKFTDDVLGDGSYDDLVGTKVRVRGVAFYDRSHKQNGKAKNCLELHPVLDIEEIP